MADNSKIRVGVLRGGPSPEYEVSLNTGKSVLKNLGEKYAARDILVDKEGNWHLDGFVKNPDSVVKHFDVIFNAMHGTYGEDGTVQKLLEDLRVPFTGAKSLPSSMAMNKHLAKKVYGQKFLRTPHYEVIRKEDASQSRLFEVYARFAKPVVVKPASSGSSCGVTLAKDWAEFLMGIEKAFSFSPVVLIEEMIVGKEATCAVVESASKKNHAYALMPIEIVTPKDKKLFDYDAKYTGISQEKCPGDFTEAETEKLQNMATGAHHALNMRHYSRSDFIVTPDDIYILETNSLPGITEESLLPKALKAHDVKLEEFLDHIIILALRDK